MFALAAGSTVGSSTPYVDDVFSIKLYYGNGATQNITTNVNLSTYGGMVWTSPRDAGMSNVITVNDTVRTNPYNVLLHGASYTATGDISDYTDNITGWGSSYYSLGADTGIGTYNVSGGSYWSATFRKAEKFLDIATYTGNGSSQITIPHNLKTVPGLVLVRRLDSGSEWFVYNHALGVNYWAELSSTNSYSYSTSIWQTAPTSSNFYVGASSVVNVSGATYIVYLLAHDTSPNGLVYSGYFSTDGSGNANVTGIGWEPQFLLIRETIDSGDWLMLDQTRGWFTNSSEGDYVKNPNLDTLGDESGGTDYGYPHADGFYFKGSPTTSYTYTVIRRSNKRPTDPTKVFHVGSTYSGTSGQQEITGVGFMPDMFISRPSGNYYTTVYTKARSRNRYLAFGRTDYENQYSSTSNMAEWGYDGFITSATVNGSGALNESAETEYHNYYFKRAKGFFDVVYIPPNASWPVITKHSLGVKPEFAIYKLLGDTSTWAVAPTSIFSSYPVWSGGPGLDADDGLYWTNYFTGTQPTTTTIETTINTNGAIVYLFANCPGICSTGLYTGNGSTLNVNCGFTSGARFVIVKRITDSTGIYSSGVHANWYMFDSVTGIVTGSESYFLVNVAASNVKQTALDAIDPYSAGFSLNHGTGIDVNQSGCKYIYLAIA